MKVYDIMFIEIKCSSEQNVTFATGSSNFHTLAVSSNGGVNIEYGLSTYEGSLNLNFTGSQMNIGLSGTFDVNITSAKDLTVAGGSQNIHSHTNSKWQSERNLQVASPIKSDGEIRLFSNGNLLVKQNITAKDSIILMSDIDCVGTDIMVIEETATLDAPKIEIQGKISTYLNFQLYTTSGLRTGCAAGWIYFDSRWRAFVLGVLFKWRKFGRWRF